MTTPTHPTAPPTTTGESRATFLARVQSALATPTRKPAHADSQLPPTTTQLARLVANDADLTSLFVANATRSGMRLHKPQASAIAATLTGLLSESPTARVAIAIADPSLRAIAHQALAASGNPSAPWHAGQSSQSWFNVDISITDVSAALAETGSLVLACSPLLPRAAFMVPPVHIAVVRSAQILPDLLDLFAGTQPTAASTLTIVSGPSKTADIEGILVTGVHGPGQLHVLLIP